MSKLYVPHLGKASPVFTNIFYASSQASKASGKSLTVDFGEGIQLVVTPDSVLKRAKELFFLQALRRDQGLRIVTKTITGENEASYVNLGLQRDSMDSAHAAIDAAKKSDKLAVCAFGISTSMVVADKHDLAPALKQATGIRNRSVTQRIDVWPRMSANFTS